MAAHHEVHLEEYVVKKLVENGWTEGVDANYDKQRALYPEDVITWIKSTQEDSWDNIVRHNGQDSDRVVLDRLEKELNSKTSDTMKVLRDGFSVVGAGKIQMSQKAPEDERNPDEIKKYKSNILRVVRQLKYHPSREFSIDLGFFINGLPVATVELKTDFTQSIDDAVEQYKNDRLPVDPKTNRKEPLLTFRRGAVVHFAMSDSEIQMCTNLNGGSSIFLPFNKGNNGHAGNAAREDGEYPVAYFWEEVCQWDNWLRIFHSFVYVETSEKVDKYGKPYPSEIQIFPRYHQLEAVNTMIDDAKKNGPGMQYLCEHSAGSGKTSTIAWTAHDLTKLRHPDGKAYFNSVIIVTDRTVLDSQLQDAVQQIDHQYGMIRAIDRENSSKSKSVQLAEALKDGSPIIIVTIQTFPHAMEAILTEKSLKDRSFAVIIDEAHTSQTGSTAQGLRGALSLDSKAKLEDMTVEDLLLEVQNSRVRSNNISQFAFTATPKHSTMTLFGRPENPALPPSKTNMPVSFHRYTQRQAIEEDFILDVLENYIPYKTAFKLGSDIITGDKRVDKKHARRAIAQWENLHPTNVTQKVQFIMEHFMKNIANLLDGEAKAMVVTSRRPVAVKYKLAFDKYIQKHAALLDENGIKCMKALVAFSGKVDGKDCGEDSEDIGIDYDAEYTEYNLNPDAQNQDLRHVFDKAEFKVMIVANKFQTGFNQPKLVAMYLDKKISGVDAVQTLSRLNRTYPGKDTTYVIDFANDPEEIYKAFKKYDDGAEIEDVQSLDVVYDMKSNLDSVLIYNAQDLENFKNVNPVKLYASGRSDDAKHKELHRKLYAATQRPTDAFNAMLAELTKNIKTWDQAFDRAHRGQDKKAEEIAEAKRSEYTVEREKLMRFKSDLSRFVRTYTYIAQLIQLGDPELENFAGFAKLFAKRLKGVSPEQIDLSGLVLQGYAIRKINEDEEKELEKDTLKPIEGNDSEANDREKEFIDQIIGRLNDIFGDIGDSVDHVSLTAEMISRVKKDEVVSEQLKKNTKEQALEGDIGKFIRSTLLKSRGTKDKMVRMLMSDQQNMDAFMDLVYDAFSDESGSLEIPE